MAAADDLLATSEVSALLRVSIQTVNRMANDGRLKVAKKLPGERGARLYAKEDVLALAAKIREERLATIPPEYQGVAS